MTDLVIAPGAVISNSFGFPILTLVLLLPALAALVNMSVNNDSMARTISAVAVLVNLVLSLALLVAFKFSGGAGWIFQFQDRASGNMGIVNNSTLGISYWLGLDGISAFLVPLTCLVMAVAVLAANFMLVDRLKSFLTLMLFLQTAILGVFLSLNLFLFFVFWEAMLIPCYFLLGIWGEERRIYATMKFLVYTIFGSFFMLVGIFYLWATRGTLDMVGPNGLIAHPVSPAAQTWLFLAFGIAFAIKLPIWPFHTWAPTAYSEAPTPFVLVLSGVLSKAGAFGFLRYCLPLFPSAARQFSGLLSVLCIIGMLYAAGLALVQTDTKKLIAYSSVSHMNLIALGLFAFNATALDGSVLQMINHSLIITGLFLAVAYIAARTGTRMIPNLGGLGARYPWLMWLFFVFVLAGLDLPGLGSFSGEFLILAGVFRSNAWYAGIATLTVIMAAWYMIRLFQDTMNGPLTASPEQVAVTVEDPSRTEYQYPVVRRLLSGDLLPREAVLWVPLVALIVYIGVQPDTLTRRINPTTQPISNLVKTVPATSQVSVGQGGQP